MPPIRPLTQQRERTAKSIMRVSNTGEKKRSSRARRDGADDRGDERDLQGVLLALEESGADLTPKAPWKTAFSNFGPGARFRKHGQEKTRKFNLSWKRRGETRLRPLHKRLSLASEGVFLAFGEPGGSGWPGRLESRFLERLADRFSKGAAAKTGGKGLR